MAFEYAGEGALDYFPCRYGKSKLLFRGPRRRLDVPYVAAIGGSETYGKFVAQPWPELLEMHLGMQTVNFGYLNAGVDVFLHEPQIAEATKTAELTVIQLMGAANMSNRFYAVHPRRNDRFLRASNLMRAVFNDVDFTEFNFTRHMLSALRAKAPDRYASLVQELQLAWVARMHQLLEKTPGRKVLLWLNDYHPDSASDPLGAEPLLITEEMVAEIRSKADDLVRVTPSPAACGSGTQGMHFAPLEEPAAATMPGPKVHEEIAAALGPVISRML
ncbi:hypothetical protein BFP70_18645 [Thioclava sp. SK-1]|uniref:DUF6473 family protein n=1 Tax=Thioclava sp. SK-1 TaxID=1889770 RepID=UPI000824C9DE|nr:DUF6473 family protein [Thioclava sp. SK-1]OCX58661.1 hypothetical protein BFP70_18645 [Thioclava sp. SK-1]